MSPIFITASDMNRLLKLVDATLPSTPEEMRNLRALEDELDRADVLDPQATPPDLITMNSEVSLRDLDSGENIIYRLVYPGQTRSTPHAISILAPVGTGLLGYRVGDVIEWAVPRGIRRLEVLAVRSQGGAAC